jgi:hypothetical protein
MNAQGFRIPEDYNGLAAFCHSISGSAISLCTFINFICFHRPKFT